MKNKIKIVYAFITGDLFHVGHLRLLKRAKKLGGKLIVGVITDKGVTKYKRKPIISLKQRLEIIRELKCVDKVIVQKNRDPTEELKRLKPNILVHGNDWLKIPGSNYIKSIGGKVIRLPYTKRISTTFIIKKIREVY